jgi:21S rRNA (GM2251-2'-O)-methyltransferase
MYGSNAVLACLSAKKRQCYHLYINRPAMKGLSDKKNRDKDKKNLEQIEQLARAAQIPITTDDNPALLDRMSNRRPHNGVVLETSQIPAPPVLGLGKPDLSLSMMPVELDRQSAEEVTVNGAPSALPTLTNTWRHPFILMLDGILDEGNMGNIIRTAYFYGVDAVAVSKNTCASVNSAIVSKASSGAIEAVQILSLPQPSKFVYNSLLASWRVYAAVAPTLGSNIPANEAAKYLTHSSVAAASPLRDHPCILMLGAEGEGLRDNLKNRADYFVSIEQGERGSMPGGLLPGIGVDSMNVASAAGILVESFMRKPAGALPLGIGSALGF